MFHKISQNSLISFGVILSITWLTTGTRASAAIDLTSSSDCLSVFIIDGKHLGNKELDKSNLIAKEYFKPYFKCC